ncbi:uncharacterized protein BKA55DRAFT_551234 [Fusarium redolens]|uniref:Uncharacterized protein n=1 Tax=Fusarium redolens TaxID=48865 RepID=A0A9P9R914_FUSRE|nr:uncharacterized protein BKA55DRAFT_551234 [Fusarium redolens]KAH7270307.1 hypothetical protein BKA55DRAFT_551234 [Fusarium redolens]
MARNSSDGAEILVHITAPSRSTDDVSYRQLAQAYLAFEPQSRTQLSLIASQTGEEQRHVPERYQGAPSPTQTRVTTSFGRSFEITSQDLSFEGVIDNRSSPCLPREALARSAIPSSDHTGFGSINSWCAPASQVSDSYPMPEAALLDVSPSRILQSYIRRTQSSQASASFSSPTAHKKRPPVPEYGHRVDIPSSLPPPSQEESLPLEVPGFIGALHVVPTTPQPDKAAEVPIPSADTEVIAFEHLAPDITHISGSVVSSHSPAPSPRAGSEPPPSKRSKIGHLEHGDLVRSSSDTGPVLSTRNSQGDQVSSSLEIRPSSPSVGVDDVVPADLISEKLAKLARDLSSRYRPTTKRDIEPFERGYWLLNCSDWDPTVRFDTWVFLANYLKSGLAGWGTWCRRDKTHDWIRLYCWGHVAKHTYLLLYLASGRQVKTNGAKWYGADGEVALEIPPYEKQG